MPRVIHIYFKSFLTWLIPYSSAQLEFFFNYHPLYKFLQLKLSLMGDHWGYWAAVNVLGDSPVLGTTTMNVKNANGVQYFMRCPRNEQCEMERCVLLVPSTIEKLVPAWNCKSTLSDKIKFIGDSKHCVRKIKLRGDGYEMLFISKRFTYKKKGFALMFTRKWD